MVGESFGSDRNYAITTIVILKNELLLLSLPLMVGTRIIAKLIELEQYNP